MQCQKGFISVKIMGFPWILVHEKDMGAAAAHSLYILPFILISMGIFSNLHLMAGAWELTQESRKTHDLGLVDKFGREKKENKIDKVSGEEESGEMSMLVLERFRPLLRLTSYIIESPLQNDEEHPFSPAPAPVEAEAVTPIPVPSLPHRVPLHAPSPQLKTFLPPLPKNSLNRGGGRNEGRVRMTVIAVVVSSLLTFIIILALPVILIRWRLRSCPNTSGRTMQLSTIIGSGSRRLKVVNHASSLNKVSFDPGPELSHDSSLGFLPQGVPFIKQTCPNVNAPSTRNPSSSPSSNLGESSRYPTKLEFEWVNCCSINETLPQKPFSSDDESFHSFQESHSSKARLSNASDANYSNPSMISSPLYLLERSPSPDHNLVPNSSINPSLSSSPSPDHNSVTNSSINPSLSSSLLYLLKTSPFPDNNFTAATQSLAKSSSPPITSDSGPALHVNLQSFPSPPDSPSSSLKPTPTKNTCSSCGKMTSQNTACNSLITTSSTATENTATVPSSERTSPSLSSSSTILTPAVLPGCPIVNPNGNSFPSPNRSVLPLESNASISKQTQSASLPSSMPHPTGSPSTTLHVTSHSTKSTAVTGKIPRPPCPPPPPILPAPFLKGHNSIQRQATVALQGQQPAAVAKGPPLPKLKPLHWDKVRATPECSMVWDKLRSSSFKLDEEMIESLFGYDLQTSMKNESAKSKSPSPNIHILDPKRLQNITILSKALNATSEQVCDALKQGNGLRAQQLEALVKMVPTKEEEEELSNYQGNIDELGSAEKLVMEILNIPFAFQRIEAMLYRATFEDEVDHLRKSFAMLEKACKELRLSRLFLKLLEAVLKTGNRMNVGTTRGGATAFKLDALLKLADVKGSDGKTTLLHFVVQEMIRSEGIELLLSTKVKKTQKISRSAEEREEDHRIVALDIVSGLSTELCNVKKTASIDLDILASSVSNLLDGLVKVQNLIQKHLPISNENKDFIYAMKSFLNHAEKDIKELKEDENQVLLNVREITRYFHGDVSKDEANPLRIFVIVRDFLGMLDRVCKEVRSSMIQSIPNLATPFRFMT